MIKGFEIKGFKNPLKIDLWAAISIFEDDFPLSS